MIRAGGSAIPPLRSTAHHGSMKQRDLAASGSTADTGDVDVKRGVPGKRSRVEARYPAPVAPAVQAKGMRAGGETIHAAAAEGVTTPTSALPHLSDLQASFGDHDLSSVKPEGAWGFSGAQ